MYDIDDARLGDQPDLAPLVHRLGEIFHNLTHALNARITDLLAGDDQTHSEILNSLDELHLLLLTVQSAQEAFHEEIGDPDTYDDAASDPAAQIGRRLDRIRDAAAAGRISG